MSGILYLVGTPIGNLSDFSPRAVKTLSEVDFIAAEDTRVSVKILNHFEIKKPLISYYEHNRTASGAKILERLLRGESCALVSDAGMPAISDPGEDLVKICSAAGVSVITIPGPTALVSALAVSGLPTQRFCFEGFLSTTKKNRFEHLSQIREEKRTLIFYEAPHKLLRTLADMLDYLGDRDIAICREITKLHEETIRCNISSAIAHFEQRAPKGEFVIVIKGAEDIAPEAMSQEEAMALVQKYRDEGMSLKSACKTAAEPSGFSKNELYDMAVRG